MGRLFGKFFGNALIMLILAGVGFAIFFYTRAHVTPKQQTTLTAQVQFDLDQAVQMKNVVTLTPRGPEDDAIVDVKVEFFASPPDIQRGLLVHDTNMVVRRDVKDVGQLDITFADPKPVAAPTVADAGPLPSVIVDGVKKDFTKPTVTQTPAAPKTGTTGVVTLVTFPEAYVTDGAKPLGKTPLFKLKLPAGTHVLTLTGVDGVAHALSVPVVAGQTRAFKLNLAELPTK